MFTEQYIILNRRFKFNLGALPCADPGIFVRGVQVNPTKKKSSEIVFFFSFFSPHLLILSYRIQLVNFKDIYHFSRFQRGSNIFQGGPTFFRGGGGPIAYSL